VLQVWQLRHDFDAGFFKDGKGIAKGTSPHLVVHVLLEYLEELPSSLYSPEEDKLLKVAQNSKLEEGKKAEKMAEILSKLSPVRQLTLRILCVHLGNITKKTSARSSNLASILSEKNGSKEIWKVVLKRKVIHLLFSKKHEKMVVENKKETKSPHVSRKKLLQVENDVKRAKKKRRNSADRRRRGQLQRKRQRSESAPVEKEDSGSLSVIAEGGSESLAGGKNTKEEETSKKDQKKDKNVNTEKVSQAEKKEQKTNEQKPVTEISITEERNQTEIQVEKIAQRSSPMPKGKHKKHKEKKQKQPKSKK